jgi:hypothetical protein
VEPAIDEQGWPSSWSLRLERRVSSLVGPNGLLSQPTIVKNGSAG